MLHNAGIHSVEQLRALGAVEAYLTIKRQGMAVSLNMLYATEGAVSNTYRNKPDRATREALLMAMDANEGDES